MATETQYPDAILEQSGWLTTPAVTAIDEDPDSPAADWIVAASTTSDPVLRVSFPTPSGNPTGVQTFKAYVRKNGGTGTPTVRMDLYENGALLASGTAQNVTNTTGMLLSQSFDLATTPLGTADGSLVEVRLVVVHAGGSGTARASVDLNAINWDTVNYTPPGPPAPTVGTYGYGNYGDGLYGGGSAAPTPDDFFAFI